MEDNFDVNMYDEGAGISEKSVTLESTALEYRPEALYLCGVNDLSTVDVETYISHYISDYRPLIEWIDDSALCVVYKDETEARTALAHLTNEALGEDLSVTFRAKPNPEKSGDLTIRTALQTDKKIKGAKDRSRYYLFHPEADPDNPENTRRRRTRYTGPYEASRPSRKGRRQASDTDEDLFSGRLVSKSLDVTENNGSTLLQTDLFHQTRSHPGSGSEDVFANRIASLKPQRSSRRTARDDRGRDIQVDKIMLDDNDLFANRLDRVASTSKNKGDLFSRISPRSNVTKRQDDLFPTRRNVNGSTPSLLSRIGGPIRNEGIHIRGRSTQTK